MGTRVAWTKATMTGLAPCSLLKRNLELFLMFCVDILLHACLGLIMHNDLKGVSI